jgi:hypothetical protein
MVGNDGAFGLLQAGGTRLGFSLSKITHAAFRPLSFPGHDTRGQKGGAIWMDNKAVTTVRFPLAPLCLKKPPH